MAQGMDKAVLNLLLLLYVTSLCVSWSCPEWSPDACRALQKHPQVRPTAAMVVKMQCWAEHPTTPHIH